MINYLLALQSLVRVSDWLIDVFIVFVLMYCANQNKIMLMHLSLVYYKQYSMTI